MANRLELLAARVPPEKKARLKEIAANRGTTIQALLNSFVDQTIDEAAATPPTLAQVIARLRALAPTLRARGVRRLCVFGSVARGEASRGSDVDLFAEFEPGLRIGLVRLGSIKSKIEDALGCKVDIGDRAALSPAAAAAAERDAVEVFG
jgi:predicted nucleotidyltransferase